MACAAGCRRRRRIGVRSRRSRRQRASQDTDHRLRLRLRRRRCRRSGRVTRIAQRTSFGSRSAKSVDQRTRLPLWLVATSTWRPRAPRSTRRSRRGAGARDRRGGGTASTCSSQTERTDHRRPAWPAVAPSGPDIDGASLIEAALVQAGLPRRDVEHVPRLSTRRPQALTSCAKIEAPATLDGSPSSACAPTDPLYHQLARSAAFRPTAMSSSEDVSKQFLDTNASTGVEQVQQAVRQLRVPLHRARRQAASMGEARATVISRRMRGLAPPECPGTSPD